MITAQLEGANSFIFRFSPRFFSLCKLLIKKAEQKTLIPASEDGEHAM